MGTRPCRHCENPVAKSAKTCPACGGKSPHPPSFLESFLGFALVVFASIWLWGRCSEANTLNPDEMPPDLVEQPAWYKGDDWQELPLWRRQDKRREWQRAEEKAQRKAEEERVERELAPKILRGAAVLMVLDKEYSAEPPLSQAVRVDSRWVVWLPARFWNNLSSEDRRGLRAWMNDHYVKWGIGVGFLEHGFLTDKRIVAKSSW